MPDVIVVGAGLSGMTASYALHQARVDHTLIEVQPRPGGSIETRTTEAWRTDGDAFMVRPNLDEAWLESLGLPDALHHEGQERASFRQGTGALIDALSQRITAPRMTRMAVASIGTLDTSTTWGICLENGLMLTARAVIIALPAPYARRILTNVDETIVALLQRFDYDTIQRVNLGIPLADASVIHTPFDMAYPHYHISTCPQRIPADHALLQVAMRIGAPRPKQSPKLLVSAIEHDLRLPHRPTLLDVRHWAQSDLLTCHEAHHVSVVQTIHDRLPDTLALIGSDYSPRCAHYVGIYDLGERITRAQAEVARLLSHL